MTKEVKEVENKELDTAVSLEVDEEVIEVVSAHKLSLWRKRSINYATGKARPVQKRTDGSEYYLYDYFAEVIGRGGRKSIAYFDVKDRSGYEALNLDVFGDSDEAILIIGKRKINKEYIPYYEAHGIGEGEGYTCVIKPKQPSDADRINNHIRAVG